MVCELCVDQADARGWTREGAPALPVQLARAARSAACARCCGRESGT